MWRSMTVSDFSGKVQRIWSAVLVAQWPAVSGPSVERNTPKERKRKASLLAKKNLRGSISDRNRKQRAPTTLLKIFCQNEQLILKKTFRRLCFEEKQTESWMILANFTFVFFHILLYFLQCCLQKFFRHFVFSLVQEHAQKPLHKVATNQEFSYLAITSLKIYILIALSTLTAK